MLKAGQSGKINTGVVRTSYILQHVDRKQNGSQIFPGSTPAPSQTCTAVWRSFYRVFSSILGNLLKNSKQLLIASGSQKIAWGWLR
jgi:hypothetical protein